MYLMNFLVIHSSIKYTHIKLQFTQLKYEILRTSLKGKHNINFTYWVKFMHISMT